MTENSKIEWTDHTFNPWVGCTKISPACDNCYAEGWARRTGQGNLWQGELRRTSDANWQQPIKWNRKAAEAGRRARVFAASLADVFDNQADPQWRSDLFALIEATPALDWLLLTKRPQNVRKMIWPKWDSGMPENIWLGTTVENQAEADRRIEHLIDAPAAVRFLSCEPLLGPVNLFDWIGPWGERGQLQAPPMLDWVICGGESGPGARPMHPDWARDLRDQCAAADVPFFFKQWGDLVTEDQSPLDITLPGISYHLLGDNEPAFFRVGKKAAGRMLDGKQWNLPPSGGRAA